ncbi:UNVERIFIED_CONTAM: putative membrane protein [Brevibacillus sp. OAP136]
MKKIIWTIILFFALAISAYSIVQYFVVGVDKAGLVNVKIKNTGPLQPSWYTFLYLHIAFSAFALVTGPFLFSAKLREKRLSLHRSLGKAYLVSVLLGGLAGAVLAFSASGGFMAASGFFLLSVLWLYTGYAAYQQIKQKNVKAHREWMLRNYALTLAGVTLRLWMPICFAIWGVSAFASFYPAIAWICWVPNLLVAEWYVRKSAATPAIVP